MTPLGKLFRTTTFKLTLVYLTVFAILLSALLQVSTVVALSTAKRSAAICFLFAIPGSS